MKFLATLFLVLTLSTTAYAQQRLCLPHTKMVEYLNQRGQGIMVRSLSSDGALIEIYATEDGMNWTATITTPLNNASCLLMTGTHIFATDHPAVTQHDTHKKASSETH